MKTLLFVVIAALAIVAGFFIWKKYFKWRDAGIKMPDAKRQGILAAWYGSIRAEDYDNTKDHTNVFWYNSFWPFEDFLSVLKRAESKIVLELAEWLVHPDTKHPGNGHRIMSTTAEEDLRAMFQRLRDEGVLHKITYLTVIDEPQLTLKSKGVFEMMLMVAKKVAGEFEELNGVKWLALYFHETEFWFLDQHDIVGVDSYPQKSMVLTKGEHARLMKEKAPHQKVLIVPGAANGQNPDDFVAYAHKTDDVEMVVGFLWFKNAAHGTDKPGNMGVEGADDKFKAKWIEAMKTVMQK